MKTVGIDIGPKSFMGLAFAVNSVPTRAVVWKPSDKRDSFATILDEQYAWTCRWLAIFKPDVVAVEQQAGFVKNNNVIRVMARSEGVAIVAAKRHGNGAIVLNPPISQARGIVFGKGNLSKDDAWLAFRKQFPDFSLLAKNSGGTDQMDAMVHALAAPTVLERR